MAINANGSSSTGSKSWTLTADNLATASAAAGQGTLDPDNVINVSAYGSLAARRRTKRRRGLAGKLPRRQRRSGTVNFGTSGADTHRTRVTLAATGVANADGISLSGGTGSLFNAAGSTADAAPSRALRHVGQ